MRHKRWAFIYFVLVAVSLATYLWTNDIAFAVLAILYTIFNAEQTIIAEIKDALQFGEDD